MTYARVPPLVRDQVVSWVPVVLALGIVLGGVALALNPWRVDRLPDRFPHIVQDAIAIALFAVVATLILQEKVLATTAVGAVVIGFALQDTLGNLFSGLAIQVEKPFRVGEWVSLGGKDGMVSEITWRATKLRTIAGNVVIVPNSVLARDTIINYSEPTAEFRLEVEVGVSYDAPPNEVKAVILGALRGEPMLSPARAPDVLLADFAASAISYRVRFWASDFAAGEKIKERVRTRIYYALRRHNLTIPYPIQTYVRPKAPVTAAASGSEREAAVDRVEIFRPLAAEDRHALLARTRPVLYAAGETIVAEGDAGSSMFVVVRGEAVVSLASGMEVARFGPGGFFGEMSLLTGEPRTATVSAVSDCELLEITVEAFREFVVGEPSVLDLVGTAVATRRNELERRRAAGTGPLDVEPAPSFLSRVRNFLRLSAAV